MRYLLDRFTPGKETPVLTPSIHRNGYRPSLDAAQNAGIWFSKETHRQVMTM